MSPMRPASIVRRRARQRGLTLFGLMFWAIVVGFVAYVLVRTVFPTVNEYLTIKRTVEKVAASSARHRGRGPRRLRQAEGHRILHQLHLRQGPRGHQGKRQGRDRLRLRQGDPALRPGVPADQVRRAVELDSRSTRPHGSTDSTPCSSAWVTASPAEPAARGRSPTAAAAPTTTSGSNSWATRC
jgi:hypothetical protein